MSSTPRADTTHAAAARAEPACRATPAAPATPATPVALPSAATLVTPAATLSASAVFDLGKALVSFKAAVPEFTGALVSLTPSEWFALALRKAEQLAPQDEEDRATLLLNRIPERDATTLRSSPGTNLTDIPSYLVRAYPESAWADECYRRLHDSTLLAGLQPAQAKIQAERAFSRMGLTSHNAVLILTHLLEVFGRDPLASGRKIPNVTDTTAVDFQTDLDELMDEVYDAWVALRTIHSIMLLPSQIVPSPAITTTAAPTSRLPTATGTPATPTHVRITTKESGTGKSKFARRNRAMREELKELKSMVGEIHSGMQAPEKPSPKA